MGDALQEEIDMLRWKVDCLEHTVSELLEIISGDIAAEAEERSRNASRIVHEHPLAHPQ